jgi:hypothetical protein
MMDISFKYTLAGLNVNEIQDSDGKLILMEGHWDKHVKDTYYMTSIYSLETLVYILDNNIDYVLIDSHDIHCLFLKYELLSNNSEYTINVSWKQNFMHLDFYSEWNVYHPKSDHTETYDLSNIKGKQLNEK